MNMSRK